MQRLLSQDLDQSILINDGNPTDWRCCESGCTRLQQLPNLAGEHWHSCQKEANDLPPNQFDRGLLQTLLIYCLPTSSESVQTCRVPQTRRRTRKAFQMIIVCWPMRREGCAGTKGRSFSVVSKIPLWFSPNRRHSLRLLVSLASIRTLLEDVADGFVE